MFTKMFVEKYVRLKTNFEIWVKNNENNKNWVAVNTEAQKRVKISSLNDINV